MSVLREWMGRSWTKCRLHVLSTFFQIVYFGVLVCAFGVVFRGIFCVFLSSLVPSGIFFASQLKPRDSQETFRKGIFSEAASDPGTGKPLVKVLVTLGMTMFFALHPKTLGTAIFSGLKKFVERQFVFGFFSESLWTAFFIRTSR